MKKLLIVIDYQQDFVDGALGFADAACLEKPICDKILEYEREGEVVYTLDTHDSGYLDTQEGKKLPVPHCIKGTAGHGLYGRTAELLAGKRAFEKNTFGSDRLFDYLRGKDYGQIELVGLVSGICVISNAVLAKTACPEAEIIVDSACTAANDPEWNRRTLEVMAGLQVTVL